VHVAGFALGREVAEAKAAGWLFFGRAKVILSPLLHLYPS